jgi:hypothetical protein
MEKFNNYDGFMENFKMDDEVWNEIENTFVGVFNLISGREIENEEIVGNIVLEGKIEKFLNNKSEYNFKVLCVIFRVFSSISEENSKKLIKINKWFDFENWPKVNIDEGLKIEMAEI